MLRIVFGEQDASTPEVEPTEQDGNAGKKHRSVRPASLYLGEVKITELLYRIYSPEGHKKSSNDPVTLTENELRNEINRQILVQRHKLEVAATIKGDDRIGMLVLFTGICLKIMTCARHQLTSPVACLVSFSSYSYLLR